MESQVFDARAFVALWHELRAGGAGTVALPLGEAPMRDSVVVLPLMEKAVTAGGLVIAEQNRERPMRGLVLAVGPGAWAEGAAGPYRMPMDAEVGDLVSYGQYAGEQFEIAGLSLLLMRDIELKAKRPYGRYDIVAHLIGEGTPGAHHVYHEAEHPCEHCPKPTSTLIAEERARLVAEQNAALDDAAAAVADAALTTDVGDLVAVEPI